VNYETAITLFPNRGHERQFIPSVLSAPNNGILYGSNWNKYEMLSYLISMAYNKKVFPL